MWSEDQQHQRQSCHTCRISCSITDRLSLTYCPDVVPALQQHRRSRAHSLFLFSLTASHSIFVESPLIYFPGSHISPRCLQTCLSSCQPDHFSCSSVDVLASHCTEGWHCDLITCAPAAAFHFSTQGNSAFLMTQCHFSHPYLKPLVQSVRKRFSESVEYHFLVCPVLTAQLKYLTSPAWSWSPCTTSLSFPSCLTPHYSHSM